MKKPMRILLLLIAAITMLSSYAGANPTWYDNGYSSEQRVHLDPALAQDPVHPVSLDGLNPKLAEIEKKYNIHLQVFYVLQGDEQINPRTFAAVTLNEQVARLGGLPAFQNIANRTFCIEIVRKADNPLLNAVAGNAGSDLKKYGFDGQGLAKDSSPILRVNKKQYLPNDPSGYVMAIANEIGNDIDSYNRAQWFWHTGVWYLLAILGTLFYIFCCTRAHRALKATILDVLEGARDRYGNRHGGLRNMRANSQEVESGLTWFKDTASSSENFTGDSTKKYNALRSKWMNFYMYFTPLEELMKHAESVADSFFCFFWLPILLATRASLTTKTIKVTGASIPKQLRPVEGAPVEEEFLLLSDLMAQTHEPYAEITTECDQLEQQYDKIMDTDKQIVEAIKSCTATKTDELVAVGLAFSAFSNQYDELVKLHEQNQLVYILDPFSKNASALLEQTKENSDSLLSDIDHAIGLQKSVQQVDEAIGKATQQVKSERNWFFYHLSDDLQPIGVKHLDNMLDLVDKAFGCPDPIDPSSTSPVRHTFVEANLNPDKDLDEARQALLDMKAAIDSGNFGEADLLKDKALKSAAAAGETIATSRKLEDDVAKSLPQVAEKLATARHTYVDTLLASKQQLSELEAEFSPESFADVSGNIDQAGKVLARLDKNYSELLRTYNAQNFDAAQKQLNALSESTQSPVRILKDVEGKLEALRKSREQVKFLLESCNRLKSKLQTKFEEESYKAAISNKHTDDLSVATRRLDQLQSMAEPEKPDWSMLERHLDKLKSDFLNIECLADNAVTDRQEALLAAHELDRKLDVADGEFKSPEVKTAAQTKLAEAKAARQPLFAQLDQTVSDWSDVKRAADHAVATAQQAIDMARSDKARARTVRDLQSSIASSRARLTSSQQSRMQNFQREADNYYGQDDLSNTILKLEAIRDLQAQAIRSSQQSSSTYHSSYSSPSSSYSSPSSGYSSPSYGDTSSSSSSWGGGDSSGSSFGGGGDSGGSSFGGGGDSGGGDFS